MIAAVLRARPRSLLTSTFERLVAQPRGEHPGLGNPLRVQRTVQVALYPTLTIPICLSMADQNELRSGHACDLAAT